MPAMMTVTTTMTPRSGAASGRVSLQVVQVVEVTPGVTWTTLRKEMRRVELGGSLVMCLR
jgi:hypothetical protein